MPATVEFYAVPHPLREGQLAVLDLHAASAALAAAEHGAALERVAYVPATDGAERGTPATNGELAAALSAAEERLPRYLAGKSRTAAARAWLWLLGGLAAALLWINVAQFAGGVVAVVGGLLLPGVGHLPGAVIASLGGVLGGSVLAVVVGLLPVIWTVRRAAPHLGRARRLGRLARLLRAQRGRGAPLAIREHPALDAFVAATRSDIDDLRRQFDRLADQPMPAAATLAERAQAVLRLAHRQRLSALTEIYQRLAYFGEALERRLGQLEGRGGVFDEQRSVREVRRTRGRLFSHLAPWEMHARPAENQGVVLAAIVGGGLLVALVFFLPGVGLFPVAPGQAVIIDSPLDRIERLGVGLGVLPPQPNPRVETIQRPGWHFSWPRPFGSRHSVTLAPQPLVLRARIRPVAPPLYEVAVVVLPYQINDVPRWARVDRDQAGEARLRGALSQGLEEYLAARRRDARAFVIQRNPALRNDPARAEATANRLLRDSMELVVANFLSEVVNAEVLVENFGVVLGPPVQVRVINAAMPDG